MKKFIFICLLTSFVIGMAQEKRISFAKEFTYRVVGNNPGTPLVKMYVSSNNEFLSTVSFKDFPMYFFTDALATSPVGMEMNNRLSGYGAGSYFFGAVSSAYSEDDYALESKKLNTRETVLGMPCTHYLINFRSKKETFTRENDFLKVCIDETSPYNSFTVFNGLLKQYLSIPKLEKSSLKGLILKLAPEKDYDKEYLVLKSVSDSKDFVLIDHKKIITDQQRKHDSIMIAYKKQQDEYNNMADSAVVAADSTVVSDSDDYVYIPDYASEYKKNHQEDGNLAIHSLSNAKLWKGLPQHCKNFEKELPKFNHKELQGHLKNYVGQICDMYLTQSNYHTVGIKITLDEIRREVLYLNEIHEKLDASDKKKLNNYLKNLD